MISAIGSSTFTSPAGNGKSSAGLETQLAKYQVQLADWVSCPSCKTPEGKAKIAEISDKIGEIRQRLETPEAAKKSLRPTVTDANPPAGNNQGKTISALNMNDNLGYGALPASPLPPGTVGSRLNVFA